MTAPFGPPAGDPSQNDVVPQYAVAVTLAGSSSAVTHVGSGTALMTVDSGSAPTSSDSFVIQITTGATLASGNMRFKWSKDGGVTYTTGVVGAATVALTDGVTVDFASGTYVLNDTFSFTTLSGDFSMVGQFKAGYCRELRVGTGGTVVATMLDGTAQTYKNVQNGEYLSGCFMSVSGTNNGTTAADIVARW